MPKIKKENRLSFRITPETSNFIDKYVSKHMFLKDRSDFGTKSVDNYLEYLEVKEELLKSIKSAVIAISNKSNAGDLPEIKRLSDSIEQI